MSKEHGNPRSPAGSCRLKSCSFDDVVRITSQGLTYDEILDRYGVAPWRIGRVLHLPRNKAAYLVRSEQIREVVREANDIERSWPVEDLLCALAFVARADTCLRMYFDRHTVVSFSLREVMDWLIPVVEKPTELFDAMPAFRRRMVGSITYAAMIKGLSEANCGEAFETEWAERSIQLREYLVGTGKFYPYILHGPGAPLLTIERIRERLSQ